MQPDNLISLKDDMIAFIAGHGMRRFNGYITEEVPTVIFEEENSDGWKDFVEHAKEAGAPFITMSEVTLTAPSSTTPSISSTTSARSATCSSASHTRE
jgi:hypothetical protein